jgi:hypothetical protein
MVCYLRFTLICILHVKGSKIRFNIGVCRWVFVHISVFDSYPHLKSGLLGVETRFFQRSVPNEQTINIRITTYTISVLGAGSNRNSPSGFRRISLHYGPNQSCKRRQRHRVWRLLGWRNPNNHIQQFRHSSNHKLLFGL